MRDGINRLRHAKKYSGFFSTICVNPAWTGFIAGTGKLAGADPREMAKSDLVVIWGTNAVNTQVNVMTHATRARKERGAKIVVVDIYMNSTMRQADLPVLIRPGTDGALACAVMHCLFRDGKADWDYLERYTDAPRELDSAFAHARSGMGVADHRLPGGDDRGIRPPGRRTQARLFPPRLRLLALAQRRHQHARGKLHRRGHRRLALEGGGAFHNNGEIFHLDKSLIEGSDVRDPSIRMLDQSRIGADPHRRRGGAAGRRRRSPRC